MAWNWQVMGRDIEGRKVVVVGESSDSMCLASDAHDADVIVHAASCKVHTASIPWPLPCFSTVPHKCGGAVRLTEHG